MSRSSSSLPLRLRALRLAARFGRLVRRRTQATVYVDQRVSEYRAYWQGGAAILGASFVSLTESVWEIRLGDMRTRVANYMAGSDDSATRRIAGDKVLCYRLATEVEVPVPEHLAFRLDRVDRAERLVESHPGCWVVKPLRDTASALGVTLGVRTSREVARAAALASLYSPEMLVERMVPGESYRLLYLDGSLLHAVRRRGVRVEGDGRRSLRELVRVQFGAGFTMGAFDEETLRLQGYRPDDVPAIGHSVLVRGLPLGATSREYRTVYDEEVTNLISPAVDSEVRRVVRAVGSSFAGVDLLMVDPGRSLRESHGVFLEINTTPGIHHHYLTEEDHDSHPVAVAVLRSLLTRQQLDGVSDSLVGGAPRLEPAELAIN